jgi:hypothetical protein
MNRRVRLTLSGLTHILPKISEGMSAVVTTSSGPDDNGNGAQGDLPGIRSAASLDKRAGVVAGRKGSRRAAWRARAAQQKRH